MTKVKTKESPREAHCRVWGMQPLGALPLWAPRKRQVVPQTVFQPCCLLSLASIIPQAYAESPRRGIFNCLEIDAGLRGRHVVIAKAAFHHSGQYVRHLVACALLVGGSMQGHGDHRRIPRHDEVCKCRGGCGLQPLHSLGDIGNAYSYGNGLHLFTRDLGSRVQDSQSCKQYPLSVPFRCSLPLCW